MAKFIYVYHGGTAPRSPEEGQKAMQAWTSWFGELGAFVRVAGESPHDADAGEIFLHDAGEGAFGLFHELKGITHLAEIKVTVEHDRADQGERHERHRHVQRQH